MIITKVNLNSILNFKPLLQAPAIAELGTAQPKIVFDIFHFSGSRVEKYRYVAAGVPAKNFLFTGRVPANNFLNAERVPANNLFLSLNLKFHIKNLT